MPGSILLLVLIGSTEQAYCVIKLGGRHILAAERGGQYEGDTIFVSQISFKFLALGFAFYNLPDYLRLYSGRE